MTLPAAIFGGFSITCLLVVLCIIGWDIIETYRKPTRTQIILALAFLATWAGITMLLRWM